MNPPIPVPPSDEPSELVLSVCRSLVPNAFPLLISVNHSADSVAGECHENVKKRILNHGGEAQYGWAISDIPGWAIQAEFHSIWRADDGNLLDPTPPLHGGPRVLFLPDPIKVYEGRNIPGVHCPYDDSSRCREFASISQEMERLIYPPGEAHQQKKAVSKIKMMGLMARMTRLMMQSR